MTWLGRHARLLITVGSLAAVATGIGLIWKPAAGLLAAGLLLWIDLTIDELKATR